MIRKPVTGYILKSICLRLRKGLFGDYIDRLMEAACLVAFYGFLRCGEFTCATVVFDPQSNLTMLDVSLRDTYVSINLKASKTDPFRAGYQVLLYKNDSELCPVRAVSRYFALRRGINSGPHEPFFLLPSMKVLTRTIFLDLFSKACQSANVTCVGLKGHSFRIGAATAAAEAQVPDYLIQTLGRWKSSSYTRYTRISPQLLCRTQLQMAQHVLQ